MCSYFSRRVHISLPSLCANVLSTLTTDIVNDVFLRVHNAFGSFHTCSPCPYVFTVPVREQVFSTLKADIVNACWHMFTHTFGSVRSCTYIFISDLHENSHIIAYMVHTVFTRGFIHTAQVRASHNIHMEINQWIHIGIHIGGFRSGCHIGSILFNLWIHKGIRIGIHVGLPKGNHEGLQIQGSA